MNYRCVAGAIAVSLAAACTSNPPSGPTPPPGLTVIPAPAVVDALDVAARSHWRTLAPHVRAKILASTAIDLVDLVEYASSSPVIDPYKDNFRYVIAGSGSCDVEQMHVPVREGHLIVAPIGVSRSCKAQRGTLVLLTVSLARGRNRVGLYEQSPPAGRIDAAGLMDGLPDHTQTFAFRTLYDGDYGEILAAKIAHLDGLSSAADEFVCVRRGAGSLVLAGKRWALRPGSVFVAPSNTSFSARADGPPLEAIVIRVNHEIPGL